MKARRKDRERGQALVLIAFAFVVLVGFTALAIDGGMVYSDRRRAQNASDAGSLGGAGAAAISMENNHVFYGDFDCGSADVNTAMTEAENAALNLMLANRYGSADISVATDCQDSEPGAYFQDKYIDITTEIITETRTAFVHFVYQGLVENLVNATTRVRPRNPLAYGHAVVGLNPSDGSCSAAVEGVKLGGTGDIHIVGGGIWAEGCLSTIGDCSADVEDGSVSYGGGTHGGCGNISPAPEFQDDSLPEESYAVPAPDPADCTGSNTITKLQLNNSSNVDLNTDYPGQTLLCITGSPKAIQMTGGNLVGVGITIYIPNGGISITGGDANLSAPGADPDPDPGIPGVLFYVDGGGDIDIRGNSGSSYLGVIYAPESDITVNGTGDVGPTMNTQIIGWNVSLLGNATIDINFNQTWNYAKPTAIDLEE